MRDRTPGLEHQTRPAVQQLLRDTSRSAYERDFSLHQANPGIEAPPNTGWLKGSPDPVPELGIEGREEPLHRIDGIGA